MTRYKTPISNHHKAMVEYKEKYEAEKVKVVNLRIACKALLDAFEGYEMLAALDINVQESAHNAIDEAEPKSTKCHFCGKTHKMASTPHEDIEGGWCPYRMYADE